MRAIVIASCENSQEELINGVPIGLLSFIDRPFLQHVIESLAGQQVRDFEVVLSHLPERSERVLGDGSRWGSRIRYHLARDGRTPYRLLRYILGAASERILIVHANRLPAVDLKEARVVDGPVVTWAHGADARHWTGWGLFSTEWLQTLSETCSEGEFGRLAMESAMRSQTLLNADRMLAVRNPGEYVASQRHVLEHGFAGLLLTGRAVSPGIWISRNVTLHPKARLQRPVYLGENCEVGPDVTLGPMAIIGQNCLLDRHSSFLNTVILPGTYVGEGLELANSIANQGHIHNLDLDASLSVPDKFILGSVTTRSLSELARRSLSRLTAVLLLALLWPVLLITYIWIRRAGGSCLRRRIVSTPAPADPTGWRAAEMLELSPPGQALYSQRRDRLPGWRHFLLCFLPGLIAAAKGHIVLVGAPPRTREEIAIMEPDWRILYLSSRVGLISEFLFFDALSRTEDDAYVAEAFFAVASNCRFDLRLLGRYFRSLLTLRRPLPDVSPAP